MKKLITILIIGLIAFFLGRATITQTHEIAYKKGKDMSGNVLMTLPVKELVPIEPILPYKIIFIENTKTEIVDTAKIINEYIAEKTYSLTLFDNMHGKLNITPTIQYNKLTKVPFTFTPIEKTVYTKQKWSFFSSLSYNTFNIAGVGAGFFYNKIGIHYRYLWNTDLNVNGHEFGLNIIY